MRFVQENITLKPHYPVEARLFQAHINLEPVDRVG